MLRRKNRLRIGQRIRGCEAGAVKPPHPGCNRCSVCHIPIVRTFDGLYVATTSCALLGLLLERLTDVPAKKKKKEAECNREGNVGTRSRCKSKYVSRHVAGPQVCSPNEREDSKLTRMHTPTDLCLVDASRLSYIAGICPLVEKINLATRAKKLSLHKTECP